MRPRAARCAVLHATNTGAELLVRPLPLCSILLTIVAATSLYSQSVAAPGDVRLIVHPRVGDTLWMQLEQTIDTRTIPAATEKQPEYGPVREPQQSQRINMRMFAHSSIEASDGRLTLMSATTDSINVRTGLVGQLGASHPMAIAATDRTVHVHVTTDGAMSVVDARPGTMAPDASLQGMPPMLPSKAVSVGEEWECDIALPSVPMFGIRADGVVHAEFRLDSMTKNGRLAYVSMKGTLRREGSARDLTPGTQLVTSGRLRGFLVLDRTRGWITEAETIIQVQSDFTVRPGDKAPARSLDIRLTQRMKVH